MLFFHFDYLSSYILFGKISRFSVLYIAEFYLERSFERGFLLHSYFTESKIEHHLPFKFNVMFSYNIMGGNGSLLVFDFSTIRFQCLLSSVNCSHILF